MRSFYVGLIFVLINSSVIGQEQIETLVKQKKTIDPSKAFLMYDYRLPNWGYDNLYFDLSGNIQGSNESGKNSTHKSDYQNINFSPLYFHYFESEKKIFKLQSSVQSSFNNSKTESEGNNPYKMDQSKTNVYFQVNADWSSYLDGNCFLKVRTDNIYSYSDYDSRIVRMYQPSIRFGIGRGRVRNITPVVRALRVGESLKNLSLGSRISDEDLMALSAFFAQRNGYYKTYDRSNKYFYHDFPPGVLSKIKELSPWEVMYLHDTWSEEIGERYEGFEINSGISIRYDKKDYSVNTSRSRDIEAAQMGFYFEQIFSHNLSTIYQMGIASNGSLSKVIDTDSNYESIGSFSLEFLNLWNVIDRLLVNWDIGYKSKFSSGDNWERMDNFNTDLSFRYYIENNLSLNTQVLYNYFYNWPENMYINYDDYNNYIINYKKKNAWQIVFNLRYYLKRGLF